jgi:hypothetical protein
MEHLMTLGLRWKRKRRSKHSTYVNMVTGKEEHKRAERKRPHLPDRRRKVCSMEAKERAGKERDVAVGD